jgi:hypothetical protein
LNDLDHPTGIGVIPRLRISHCIYDDQSSFEVIVDGLGRLVGDASMVILSLILILETEDPLQDVPHHSGLPRTRDTCRDDRIVARLVGLRVRVTDAWGGKDFVQQAMPILESRGQSSANYEVHGKSCRHYTHRTSRSFGGRFTSRRPGFRTTIPYFPSGW